MDVKQYVSVLRMHSEYLRNLSTELSSRLEALEQQFAEEITSESQAAGCLDGMRELNNCLGTSTNLFYHRLHLFLSDTTREI
jgi:hypothetical protein